MYRIFIFILTFILGFSSRCFGQNIQMEFPRFAGKTYEFIIFQGSNAKRVLEGTIPSDGKFTLSIPKQYAPYTGMCRWLITGTEEGGGLDMIVFGKDFLVSCLSEKPDNENIVYAGNTENVSLNTLYKTQEQIFARHDAMLQATKAYPQTDKNYPLFIEEYQGQMKAYDVFQAKLKKDSSYAVEFLKIVNITLGIGTKIESSEETRALDLSRYITEAMNWQTLYTSGHWSNVISSWVYIHTQVFKDKNLFASDFALITRKLSTNQYPDFVNRVTHILTEEGKDDYINAITRIVLASDKIEKYEGTLTVYNRGIVGSFAPDLMVYKEVDGKQDKIALKIKELSGENYENILLVFYNSECGACDGLLKELSQNFQRLKSRRVRIVSISSDADKSLFESKSKAFPWKDVYCDFEGVKGENLSNFSVIGTPTLFLLDKDGKILVRSASLKEIL